MQPLLDAFRGPQWKPTLILLTSTVLMLTWSYVASPGLLAGCVATDGDVNALLLQTVASALLHIGSPASESFGAIVAGVLWPGRGRSRRRCRRIFF